MNESSRPQSERSIVLWGLFLLSGAAALGYQILWAKMFALTLGHEFPAVIAVVAAFFIGMAIGAAFANRILRWLGPTAFARLELLIGLWGMLTPFLILKGSTSWIAVTSILPATIAMGATLPAMAALAKIPSAYAANTLGAVLGCLITAFVLMPRFGFLAPVYICAICNFVAAFLARRFTAVNQPILEALPGGFAMTFFITGFIALGFETLGVRLLSQSLENTVYTFAAILAVYLLGQALGAAIFRRSPNVVVIFLGISISLSIWLFSFSGSLYETLRKAMGDFPLAVAASELLTTFSVFLLPTFFMGALFAQLAERAGERSIGRALMWNSLGACVGAIAVPALVFPQIGAFWALAIMAVAYFALTTKWQLYSAIGAAFALVIIGFAPRPLSLVRVPAGHAVREIREGRMATVLVTETPDAQRTLFVNNRFQMGGTAARIPELRHAHIPLLLHPAPRRALVLGLGTGITLSAAAVYPDLHADGVELLPEVVGVMENFFPNSPDSPLGAANITVYTADARRLIRQTAANYDVIIADLFHPAQDGAGFLYTHEHFQRIRARLGSGGLFCQWLPLHQLDLETFRDVTRTFLAVFPNAQAWLLRPNIDAPVVALIGWPDRPPQLVPGLVESRVVHLALNDQLRRVALADSVRLYGSFVAEADSLRTFAGEGRINTDAFPIVMFEAPSFSYRRSAPTHERLIEFLRQIKDRVPSIADSALQQKVARYIQARDVYLNALVAESAKDRGRAIDGYIESARLSEDFTSGYAQCLAIATAESKSNPEFTRKLLQRLIEAQPDRPVAKEMLDRLSR